MKNTICTKFLCIVFLLGIIPAIYSQSSIIEEFRNPSKEAQPQVWWHWMNGNITKDGVRKDILWMHRIGISGFHIFDAGLNLPQIVEHRLSFCSPEWNEVFDYALHLADSLNMTVAITSSPGWSATGGPWVTYADAMKTLNWKEMVIQGGKKYKGPLPEPNTVAGKYLTHVLNKGQPDKFRFYQDLFVYAVKMSDNDIPMKELEIKSKASDGSDVSALFDDDLATRCDVNPDASGIAWVLFEFSQPRTIKAIMQGYDDDRKDRSARRWEYSDDGIHFHSLMDSCPKCYIPFLTFNVPTTTAKYLRISTKKSGEKLDCNELKFYTVNRVQFDTEKAGFFSDALLGEKYPTQETEDVVAPQDIIDITSFYKNGILEWKAPKGRWKIYRIGYTLRGRQNNPASPEATGLEVDKLNKEAIARYYQNYFNLMNKASNQCIGNQVKYLMIDSYEAGAQTWTDNMEEEFQKRRGYSMRPWLPALFGQIVESADKTDRFLQDWRLTFGEMFAEYHYQYVDSLCAEYGLKTYVESQECDRKVPSDGMDMKITSAVPMGAFWVDKESSLAANHEADIRESASVAHIFGQNVNAAESFTVHGMRKFDGGKQTAYACTPGNLKLYADYAMSCGLNQFVIHNSSHQPVDDKVPGLGLGVYGQWFHRHETWAEQAKPWMDYLARSSSLLQQGTFVADFAVLYSETTNLTALYMQKYPPVFDGRSYDFVSANILIQSLKIDGNELVAPSGIRYKALWIEPETYYMSLAVLKKLAECARAGILIAGNEPTACLNLKYNADEFNQLIQEIWHSNRLNVIAHTDFESRLNQLCEKQVEWKNQHENLRFVHRHLEQGELFWVANLSDKPCTVEMTFAISGKKPQILHPASGQIENVSYRIENGRTTVSFHFNQYDAQFILFETNTDSISAIYPTRKYQDYVAIEGPWIINFQENRGAPEQTVFAKLQSWTENENDGVRYFSGTAIYHNKFIMDKDFNTGRSYLLELGKVKNIARVIVNGQEVGVLWEKPFQADVSKFLRQGENTLEIHVTNSWPNRMIGDLQPDAKEKYTYCSYPFFKKDSPLLESGLFGPVKILVGDL